MASHRFLSSSQYVPSTWREGPGRDCICFLHAVTQGSRLMQAFSVIQPWEEEQLEDHVSFSVPQLGSDTGHSLYIIDQIWPNSKGAAAMSWEGWANRRLMDKSKSHPQFLIPLFFSN